MRTLDFNYLKEFSSLYIGIFDDEPTTPPHCLAA